jgi:thioredoxin-related protein
MKKTSTFIILFLFIATVSFVPNKHNKKDKIEWLTISELQAAYAREPRPVLVDVYTQWCGWCKAMDKETFSNENVANYINTHYYAVKFDAESKESFTWAGKTFTYDSSYRANDFAIYLTGGQLSFPTTVLLADINAQPAPLAGFLKPGEIEPPLRFFGDGVYKSQNYPEFIRNFSVNW